MEWMKVLGSTGLRGQLRLSGVEVGVRACFSHSVLGMTSMACGGSGFCSGWGCREGVGPLALQPARKEQ